MNAQIGTRPSAFERAPAVMQELILERFRSRDVGIGPNPDTLTRRNDASNIYLGGRWHVRERRGILCPPPFSSKRSYDEDETGGRPTPRDMPYRNRDNPLWADRSPRGHQRPDHGIRPRIRIKNKLTLLQHRGRLHHALGGPRSHWETLTPLSLTATDVAAPACGIADRNAYRPAR